VGGNMSAKQSHENNFGFLRLLLAALVIFGHAPELLDGNRSREPLTQIFHSLSFGELAVDGFLLISGYLVASSYLASPSTGVFLIKRVLRIYPGFCIAWLVCMLIVAPLSGGNFWPFDAGQSIIMFLKMLCLHYPSTPGTFHGLHYPFLNGAVWTIIYEFICYLCLAVIGYFGLLKRRFLILAVATSLVLWHAYCLMHHITLTFGSASLDQAFDFLFVNADLLLRMSAFFWSGVCYFLFRDFLFRKRILAWVLAFGSILAFLFFMRIPELADFGVAVFGAYLLFFVALNIRAPWLRMINGKIDISYGVYLYAWPVSSLIILHDRHIEPLVLALATFSIVLPIGYASWYLVEKPATGLKRRLVSGVPLRAAMLVTE